MDISEDNVQMLLCMGFPNEAEVRRALRQGKDDISEAVAILTNESRNPDFDILPDMNVEMKESQSEKSVSTIGQIVPYGPYQTAPSYDDSLESASHAQQVSDNQETVTLDDSSDSLEFPVPNLIELEGRVFTESWSIPYRKDESLARCLVSATRLVEAGLVDTSVDCKRFLDRCLPESCKKLLTSAAVNRWNAEIQRGVCDMLELFIDLMAMMLAKDMCHLPLLEMLTEAFNGNCEFHAKNRAKDCDRSTWDEKFGLSHWFTEFPITSSLKDPHGWLLDLINRFGDKKGFHSVRELFNKPIQDAPTMSALLAPFGMCAERLNSTTVSPLLSPCVRVALQFVQGLTENDFKDKRIGSVCEMLGSIKLLRLSLWPEELAGTDEMRLEVVLRMLRSIHYNARMNALKEITRLLDETNSPKVSRSAIRRDELMDWLLKKKVLSIALEGNIDHVQYCDKVKVIVDFLGVELTLDELTKLWDMQRGQRSVIVDNIHAILVAAAIRFNTDQLEHLFSLIQQSWSLENDRSKEKLLSLIGRIGRESRTQRTTTRALEVLWEQAHASEMPKLLMEQALEEHLGILSNASIFATKDQLKKTYVYKCVDDIREGRWVLPALRHLLDIAKSIAKQGFNKSDRGILQELHKNHDIIRQVTLSLMNFHEAAMLNAEDHGLPLTEHTLVDLRYTHKEYVNIHLGFLQFILKEGSVYLAIARARELWNTLVASPKACAWERQVTFEWFTKCLPDLDDETQLQLFQKEFLRLDPAKLSTAGFTCFKNFFENVNIAENRLKKVVNASLMVEKMDLIGLDYVWEICINTPETDIAESAISLLLNMTYMFLSSRLKKDSATLHKKFIEECYKRLEAAMVSISGSLVSQTLLKAVRIMTAPILSDPSSLPTPAKSPTHLLNVARLLLVAERYILLVEEQHPAQRTILPHGTSFHGNPITLLCSTEAPTKMEFNIKTHNNEVFSAVRSRIANKVKHISAESLQIFHQERLLCRDQKTVGQLELEDNSALTVRGLGTPTLTSPSQSTMSIASSTKQNFDFEQEKVLPGVFMSSGGSVFEMLYQLTELDDVRVISRARSLLNLVPTDPQVLEQLDSVGQRVARSEEVSPKASPRASPRKYILGHVPPLQPVPKVIVKDTIRAMFDAQAPGMSPFRVLYNLEVLSSRLMPVSRDAALVQNAKTFCSDFLACGGLGVLVNILQKDGLPSDVDSSTRQDCYAICLMLLRYLLCGEEAVADITESTSSSSLTTHHHPSVTSLPLAASAAAAPGASFGLLTIDTTPISSSKHSRMLHAMNSNDLGDLMACLVRVSWAAAAGQLQMACAQSVTEYVAVTASRANSTSSTASTSSEGDSQWLHLGICVRQKSISLKDVTIAVEALQLLVTCLRMRPSLLPLFYNFPYVADFTTDVLVGCPSESVRTSAVRLLRDLCHINPQSGDVERPLYFVLSHLLKARLPFWVSSSITRGTNYRLLRQCRQYFELRCHLTQSLSIMEQQTLGLDVAGMLEDEMSWLNNFMPSDNKHVTSIDNRLVAGHLDLVRTGLTCEGVDKVEIGRCLAKELLHDFLFPSCSFHEVPSAGDRSSGHDVGKSSKPKCSNSESRVAAYRLLVRLCDGCNENLTLVCQELAAMHHTFNAELAKEWEYMPAVEGRALSGFVGLRNGGATCYMNAVLQQIYMAPGVSESLLAVDDERIEEDSVFHQLQQILGHLTESQLQYYSPDKFWKVFKLWGESVNIHEQQDALDFFQALLDQIDEFLKKIGRESVFKRKFQGVFSDQKICQDCPHRYEREEIFYALNVTVKNANLQDSLDQFVKGELLDGDNAYFCEKCGQKRNTIKRMCIKTLPPVLCIQLKRFDYDWEANKALKFDDYFKFPLSLDMEPYTSEGLESRDTAIQQSPSPMTMEPSMMSSGMGGGSGDEKQVAGLTISSMTSSRIVYELVGVVVHSGQANAGHYYSFIKERRDNYLTNANYGKWYKFNDAFVEEFDMNESTLESECFGGKYKAKAYDNSSSSYPDERVRYWNGYLLFYERKIEEIRTPLSAKKSKMLMKRHQPDRLSQTKRSSDSFVELTELVHKGDQRGIFSDKMPARIQREIREDNQRFLRNSGVYDADYFRFVRELVSVNANQTTMANYSDIAVQSLTLAIKFLLNTYLKTKRKLREDLDEWIALVESLLQRSKAATSWLVDYLANEGSSYVKLFILECSSEDVRGAFSRILEKTLVAFIQHGNMPTLKNFNELIEQLLGLLSRDVIENVRNAATYFQVLHVYVQLGTKACSHMLGRQAFPRLANFLLGSRSPSTGPSPDREISPASASIGQRRWSSMQARDFGMLHVVMATLVLNCEVENRRTEPVTDKMVVYKPRTVTPQIYLRMPVEITEYVFGPEASNYIREVVMCLREVDSAVVYASVCDLLLYCSFNNSIFTNHVIKNIMLQYTSAPSNELKNILSMLQELLLLEDALQTKRLQCVIDGYMDEFNTSYEGLLSTIRQCHQTDSRRSYQCIKFLVSLSTKCTLVKDYLLTSSTKWQWAVNWLKKKMTELYVTSTASQASNEDSNSKCFQRTVSAQSTLDEATALLNEMESQDDVGCEVAAMATEGALFTLSEASSSSSIASTLTTVEQVDMELDELDGQTTDDIAFDLDSTSQSMDVQQPGERL